MEHLSLLNLHLNKVFNDKDERKGYYNGYIPKDYAIKGIHHVEIWQDAYERTAALFQLQSEFFFNLKLNLLYILQKLLL